MNCRRICQTIKADVSNRDAPYRLGYKRCSGCNIFLKTIEIYCPCCHVKLRSKPKARKYKDKLMESKK